MLKFFLQLNKKKTLKFLNKCQTALLVCLLWSSFLLGENIACQTASIHVNRSFVVLVCSFNNEKYVQKNLQSIFSQSYKNFRVIYVDDHSTDKTYKKAKRLIQQKSHPCRVDLYRNSHNQGCMHNTYQFIHWCKNSEIIVLLDGDDWFAHSDVLMHLNRYYQNSDVWLTYGQYQEYPSGKLGLCGACSSYELEGNMRRVSWKTSHLRTFYAGLFKKIRKADLMKDGQFMWITSDQAFMLPMLDMAREHAFFIQIGRAHV